MFKRKAVTDKEFEESETEWLSIEDVLEYGLASEKQNSRKELCVEDGSTCENKTEMKCVFKGYRVPSSWINAVILERNGTLWL
jgi:hypothetical protein